MAATPLTALAARRPVYAPTPRPRLDVVEWLLGLDDGRFAHQVSQDARGMLRAERAEAMRDPQVLGRWASALRLLLNRIEYNLEHADQSQPDFWAWSTRTATFRKHAMRRLDETERLLAGEVAR